YVLMKTGDTGSPASAARTDTASRRMSSHVSDRLCPRSTNAGGQAAWSEFRGKSTGGRIHAFLFSRGRTIDLGTLGGRNSVVTGLNAYGHVIGWSHTRNGERHAFLWKEGRMRDLGTFPAGIQSSAEAINAKDEIVGSADTGSGQIHAFLWSRGTMTDLGDLP